MSAEKIRVLIEERDRVPEEFERIKAEVNADVNAKLASVGLPNLIQDAHMLLVEHQRKLQSRIDFLNGQISALEEVAQMMAQPSVESAPLAPEEAAVTPTKPAKKPRGKKNAAS